MIYVRGVYFGNSSEAYVQTGFMDGINIIASTDNHVGKTILMESMMFAMGADPGFPPSFEYRSYVFVVDLEVDDNSVTILRSGNTFAVKMRDSIKAFESVKEFDIFWSNEIRHLPLIVKDGKPVQVPTDLYLKMAFIPQSKRATSRITSGRFNKDDFKEMIFSLEGLDGRELDKKEVERLKRRREELRSRKRELLKQAKLLDNSTTALATASPTADRAQLERTIKQLDSLQKEISSLKNERNRAYIRVEKNRGVLNELNSLNREINTGKLLCLDCGSERVGYRIPQSEIVFDITTANMRTQIQNDIKARIVEYENEAREIESQIRKLQRRFSALVDDKQVTLADVMSTREDYANIKNIDFELSEIEDNLEEIDAVLTAEKMVDQESKKGRKTFLDALLASMNALRKRLNPGYETKDYPDLCTTEKGQYTGSEATEFFLARVYSLAKNINHGLPLLIDSFRAEELSTTKEEETLPLFQELTNQVLLTVTLKEEEGSKYDDNTEINTISFKGYRPMHLLSPKHCDALEAKVGDLGITLA